MRTFAFHAKDKGTGQPLYVDGKPVLRSVATADNPRLHDWQSLVGDAARRALEQQAELQLFVDAVSLAVLFELPRPTSLPKRVTAHTKKPDLDKLARAVKDALKGIVWKDDSQVVEIFTRKRYAEASAPARALIAIEG